VAIGDDGSERTGVALPTRILSGEGTGEEGSERTGDTPRSLLRRDDRLENDRTEVFGEARVFGDARVGFPVDDGDLIGARIRAGASYS